MKGARARTEHAGTFHAFGVRVEVQSNRARLLDSVRKALGWAHVSSSSAPVATRFRIAREAGQARYVVYERSRKLFECPGQAMAVTRLESAIRIAVADRSRGRVFVHAGVVEWNGRAIVLPGRSFAGKSTLVASLLARGAKYYSDEYAVCDSRGRIHAFPRPLRLRTSAGKRSRGASERTRAPTPPLKAGLIVAAPFDERRPSRLQSISSGNAVLALLDNTVSARSDPARALAVLERVVVPAAALKGVRGEATAFAEILLSRFATW